MILEGLRRKCATPAAIRQVLENVEREVQRLHAHIPEEIRLVRAALADEERRIANFVGFIGDGKGTAALAEALRSAENKALEAREQLGALEGTAADVFATPPAEWVAETCEAPRGARPRDGAVSPTAPENSRPIRLIPVTPQVGRPYYQAETALQVLELIQDPGGRFELVALVEAVGIEPTSGNPQPQASTSIAGLSYGSLAPRSSIRQEGRGASLMYLALPLRPGSGPATRV